MNQGPFFAKFDQIPNFFSKSPERKQAIEVSVPSSSGTQWNYSSSTLCKAAMNLDELINGFKPIISSSDYFCQQTLLL